ncbi:SDR family oxidoreductase, partial [Mammaliicoccus sciuri]
MTYSTPLEELSLASYMKIVNINQVSVFLGIKTVAKTMKSQNAGAIINISSMNGLVGGAIGYTDTKFAARGMTKAASRELSPYNIRVNSVHPGVIQTAMLEQEDVKEQVEQFKKTIPMRRVAQVEEVSNMVIFLASDEASY